MGHNDDDDSISLWGVFLELNSNKILKTISFNFIFLVNLFVVVFVFCVGESMKLYVASVRRFRCKRKWNWKFIGCLWIRLQILWTL